MLSTSLHYAPFAAIPPEGKPFGYLIELWDLWSKKKQYFDRLYAKLSHGYFK